MAPSSHTPLRPEPLPERLEDRLEDYLLGRLSDDDAERLDEQSVIDDDLAWRLRAAEDDLVDAHARGALDPEALMHFEAFYLASPRRRAKVAFACRFVRAVDRAEGLAGETFTTPPRDVSRRGPRVWWLMAAAAMVIAGGIALAWRNAREQATGTATVVAATVAGPEHAVPTPPAVVRSPEPAPATQARR